MPLSRRPHRRVDRRLYMHEDDGTYFVVVEGKPGAGPYVRKHVVHLPAGTSLNEARVVRDDIYRELEAGTYRRDSHVRTAPPTVGDVTDIYIEERAQAGVRERTLEMYQGRASNWVDLRDIPIAQLDYQRDIRPWVQRVQRTHMPGTTRAIIGILRAVVRRACQLGYCERNPLDLVQLPRETKRRQPLPAVADLHHAWAWWLDFDTTCIRARASGDERRVYFGWYTFYRILLECALRSKELRTLRWTDIADRRITIRPEVEKTGRGRQIPVTDGVEVLLVAHRTLTRTYGTAPQRHQEADDGLVFPSVSGRVMDRHRVSGRAMWHHPIRLCGLTPGMHGVRPHTLRAMGITQMAEVLPMRAVMAIAGHSSPDMHWLYHRTMEGDLAAARELLSKRDPARQSAAHLSSKRGQKEDAKDASAMIDSANPDSTETFE